MPNEDDYISPWRLGLVASEPYEFALPSGETITIGKHSILFDAWSGAPIHDAYGGKTVVNIDGQPLFAELAILHLLQDDGFDGVWVDTYRNRFRRSMAQARCTLPVWVQERFDAILTLNGKRGGCWDVLAWKNNQIVFVESKRKRKDRIHPNQRRWLAAALKAGIDADCFSICEWDLRAN
jgi:hypothetical protein